MSDVASRLREALVHSGKANNWLQRELARRHIRGSSYGSVYAYLMGRRKPGTDFLEADLSLVKDIAAGKIL